MLWSWKGHKHNGKIVQRRIRLAGWSVSSLSMLHSHTHTHTRIERERDVAAAAAAAAAGSAMAKGVSGRQHDRWLC